jgi:hypothetical protein
MGVYQAANGADLHYRTLMLDSAIPPFEVVLVFAAMLTMPDFRYCCTCWLCWI